MKFDPFLTDETSIAPPTPGAALFRLSQVIGRLKSQKANNVPKIREYLAQARHSLQEAIENGDNLGTAFTIAQNSLRECYLSARHWSENPAEQAEILTSLGFPDPRRTPETKVTPVDVSTVVATHFKPQKQVFTSLSFEEAHGATAYWLHEVRSIEGEDFVDAIVENWAPQFSRVRMPVGTHRLIIESRDTSFSVHSEEFLLEVPAL